MTILGLPKIIGCEEFPKSDHGALLIADIDDFINKQYNFSGKQVVEAFEMAATHTLYLDGKRVDPSTFGKYLSRASVGKVLTAYKESKQSNKARPSGYNSLQISAPPKKLITPAESWELVLKWTKQENKVPFCMPYEGAYQYLIENKQIKDVKNITSRFNRTSENMRHRAVEQYLIRNVINK
jgi:hypothetical protein